MKYITVIVAMLLFGACASPNFQSTGASSSEVNDIAYFSPFSYIQLIEKGNRTEHNDSLSAATNNILDSLLLVHGPSLRAAHKLETGEPERSVVEQEVAYLAHSLLYTRAKLDDLTLPPAIDSILESRGRRFGLAVVATGFGRRKGNFGGQVAKGVAVGVLTLGMYAPVPVKSSIGQFAFIFDAERNDVTYYRRVLPEQKEPTDPIVVQRQFMELFRGYLYGTGK
jgi:hypothetical protein